MVWNPNWNPPVLISYSSPVLKYFDNIPNADKIYTSHPTLSTNPNFIKKISINIDLNPLLRNVVKWSDTL